MTQEEKAKAYDEALERAKKLQENSILKKWLLHIFPKLKENEDEKIRKLLISGMKHLNSTAETFASIPIKDVIDWLEKQGNQDIDISSFPEEQQMFMRKYVSLDKITLIKLLAERDANNAEIIESFEKQSNQKPYGQRAECLDCQFNYAGECKGSCQIKRNEQKPIFNEPIWYVSKVDGKIHDMTYIPKVEPKFHRGDLAVDNCGYVWKVEGILNRFYILEGIEGGESRPTVEWVDKTFHFWTIQDAKDGDVLVNGSNIFIFHFINDTRLMGYCHVNIDDGRFYDDLGKNECFCLIDAVVNLATKEQRDLLFQKMKEAGYEWDAEKKELKKLGQPEVTKTSDQDKTEWSEEDNVKLQRIIDFLWYNRKGDTDTIYQQEQDINWVKSLKDRVQPKQEWTEEDSHYINRIIQIIEEINNATLKRGENWESYINWLKSLKQRIGWKQKN